MSTRTSGLTRTLLFLVALFFLAVSACSFNRDEGIQHFGDGSLFFFAALAHAAGLLLALVCGGLALSRRSVVCSRWGMAFVVCGTVGVMFLYALYFGLVNFVLTQPQ